MNIIQSIAKLISATSIIAASSFCLADDKKITFLFTDDDTDYIAHMEKLSKKFSEDNPGITVDFITTGYNAVLKQLPLQLAVGEGPDLAKLSQWNLSPYFLDLRPFMSDPKAFEKLHKSSLSVLRSKDDSDDVIKGYLSSETVNLPFVNVTLFEQAGVEIPKEGYTLNQLVEISAKVAQEVEVDIPFTMDRSGHRFTGPAFSYGARFTNDENIIAIPDEALKTYIKDIKDWVDKGYFPKEMWGAAGGSKYKNMGDAFINGDVVTYFAGNWMINPFTQKIKDDFDWQLLPAPCAGTEHCVAQPGGTAIVGFNHTKHPKEVAKFIEFLGNAENQRYIAENFLIITGAKFDDLKYKTDNPNTKKSLEIAAKAAEYNIPDFVRKWQVYNGSNSVYGSLIKRVGQLIVGELTLEETYALLQQDAQQIAKELATME